MNPEEAILELGATPPLEFMGEGSTGKVFCDAAGHAWKVPHSLLPELWLADEAAWLREARLNPDIKPHVPKLYRWHDEAGILERECVIGPTASERDQAKLLPLVRKISRASREMGWTVPEQVHHAWVFRNGDPERPILVDPSLVHRLGEKLIRHVREVARYSLEDDVANYLDEQIGEAERLGTITSRFASELRELVRGARKNY